MLENEDRVLQKWGFSEREREKVGDCQILRPTVIHDTGSRAFIVQRSSSIVAMLILACNPDLGRRKCIFLDITTISKITSFLSLNFRPNLIHAKVLPGSVKSIRSKVK